MIGYAATMSQLQEQHHEGSTCAFCSKTDVCSHPQIHGAAVCTAAPWVPNTWVKSIQPNG